MEDCGSTKPPHALSPEEQKPVDIKNMYIDIGVRNKEAKKKRESN